MNTPSNTEKVPLPPAAGSALRPARGEVWNHQHHGAVTIVRSWGDRESVCEIHSRASWPKERRRAILANELMSKQP